MALPLTEQRAVFYDESRPLLAADARSKFNEWIAGQPVASDAEVVGSLALDEDEQLFMAGGRILGEAYGQLDPTHSLRPRTNRLYTDFLGLVLTDARRNGLGNYVRWQYVFGGR